MSRCGVSACRSRTCGSAVPTCRTRTPRQCSRACSRSASAWRRRRAPRVRRLRRASAPTRNATAPCCWRMRAPPRTGCVAKAKRRRPASLPRPISRMPSSIRSGAPCRPTATPSIPEIPAWSYPRQRIPALSSVFAGAGGTIVQLPAAARRTISGPPPEKVRPCA